MYVWVADGCVCLQGYSPEHKNIELLKLRNFTVGTKIPDSHFTAEDSLEKMGEIIGAMVGYVRDDETVAPPRRVLTGSPGNASEQHCYA